MIKNIAVSLLLIVLSFYWISNWFGNVVPLNAREENIIDQSLFSILCESANDNLLFSPWNPSTLTGNTNIIQRGYFLFMPMSIACSQLHIPKNLIYISTYGLLLSLSGIGLFFYLRSINLSFVSSFFGATVFMFLPPHITLTNDFLDFHLFWTTMPWLLYFFRRYSITNNYWLYGGLVGLCLSVSLISGTTYFVSTFPILLTFSFLSLYLSQKNTTKTVFKFYIISGIFFICLSAYVTFPATFEYNNMWISQESLRRNIFNILSLNEIVQNYFDRVINFSPLRWKYAYNFPDFSFYLSIPATFISLITCFIYRNKIKILLPYIFLLLVFIAFTSLHDSLVHQTLKFITQGISYFSTNYSVLIPATGLFLLYFLIVLLRKKFHFSVKKIASVIVSILIGSVYLMQLPKFQSSYDHTYRMFIFPTVVLSIFTAMGIHTLMSKAKRWSFLIICVLGFVFFADLYPFSSFFRSAPLSQFLVDKKTYQQLNSDPTPGRYWTPFPFSPHLPKYRLEYPTQFITDRERLNNENMYTPFTPLYSTQLLDVYLFGAVEQDKITSADLLKILDWGFANIVIFRKDLVDYSKTVSYLITHEWNILSENDRVIILKNTKPFSYIHLYSQFSPISKNEKMNPSYWIKHSSKTALYESQVLHIKSTMEGEIPNIISWKKQGPLSIYFEVDSTDQTLAVVSEAWYPGWHVEVDHREGLIVRGNYAFLGTIVPAGKHTIYFYYQTPWYYHVGFVITLISLCAIGCIMVKSYNLPEIHISKH